MNFCPIKMTIRTIYKLICTKPGGQTLPKLQPFCNKPIVPISQLTI